MTRKFIRISIIILISVNCYSQNKIHFTPNFNESKETTHKIPKGQDYTFGYLEVLENRDNPDGNRIKLPIYIFKSRSKNSKPDPIIYTVGGPGYTSMRASKYMEYYKYPEVKGLSPTVFDNEVCKIWGVKKVAEIENQAVRSDIPVLLISGEYDELTPVKWAESMSNNLTNSYHLIFKGWKHGPTTNWSNPCAMQAADDFFNKPTELPKPDCFDQIKSPKFKTE